MSDTSQQSPWRIPLVREIGVILVIKLIILFSIKAIWFSAPTVPSNGTERFDAHLFQTAAVRSPLPTEEKPR
jgi:hypothetical protein